MSTALDKEFSGHACPSFSQLCLAGLGIVFGDIGTSPLYTLKTVFDLAGGSPSPDAALGLLSLILWTLLVTVSFKYVSFVMGADNDGEGGILALMSLLRKHKHHRPLIIALGLFGAALIYGDGAITPAISVLSAIEGLKISAPGIAPYVLPISVVILTVLFAFQSQGTARIGWVFGPVMVVWFFVIGALGLAGIIHHPAVFMAFNPWYGVKYLITGGMTGFMVLGGVFLAVTGAEALYADMGHIGAKPIRLAWYGLVLPALFLNYMGQTALYLAGGDIEGNIFYRLCPPALLTPMIILATLATIIASQAIITGAYSMTRQAIHMGWWPRMKITQTSSEGYGQIYIAGVNWALMTVTLALTVIFGSSDNLAAAYGIAVSLTMLLTTCLLFVVMHEIWHWKKLVCYFTAGSFFCIDAVFLAANSTKIVEGGWVPLFLAVITYTLMVTWRRGSVAMTRSLHALTMPVSSFFMYLQTYNIARVPGTAVFLSKTTGQTPPLIIRHVMHSRALHQNVITLAIAPTQTPWVASENRLRIDMIAPNFWRIICNQGFMEKTDIPAIIQLAKPHLKDSKGRDIDLDNMVYYIGHETIRHRLKGKALPVWQERLFAVMQRNSAQIYEYLSLPPESVTEIGRQIEI